MPCPVASTMGAVTALGGAHSLLFRDPRYRAVTWATLIGLTAGWILYFTIWRTAPARIGLEVLSVGAVIAAGFRVRHLMRAHGVVPPLYRPTSRVLAAVWPVLGSPGVLAGKVWLLAMLVMEWRGKAHFAPLEYAAVGAVVLAMAVWRSAAIGRRPFAALESYGPGAAVPACPLGFGCRPEPSARGPVSRPAVALHHGAAVAGGANSADALGSGAGGRR